MRNLEESLERVVEILQGRSPIDFLQTSTLKLRQWLETHPDGWRMFGPYWGAVQHLMREFQPDFTAADHWAGGDDFPDYLQHYMRGDDILKWVDAMDYLNRNGDYLENPGMPHLVTMADGDRRYYDPLSGLLER